VDATSILDNCVVEYAGTHNYGIRTYYASPRIQNSTIRQISYFGIYLSASSSTVENCAISSTGNTAIYSDSGGSPVFLGNAVTSSNAYGIYVGGATNGQIENNTVTSPVNYGIYISGTSNALVRNNVVANSIFFDTASGDPVISGNTFSNLTTFPPR